MNIQCGDILELPSLEKLKIIAGRDGLHRPLRWVHMAEVLEDVTKIIEWTHGGELLIITGVGVKNNPHRFIDLIQTCYDSNLAGIIVFLGPYIEKIPEEVIEKADDLSFPLFTIPWEIPIVEITHDICNHIIRNTERIQSVHSLIENILFYDIVDPQTILNQGKYFGFDLNQAYRVFIVDIDDFAVHIHDKNLNEHAINELKNEYLRMVNRTLELVYPNPLSMLISDSIIIFYPEQLRISLEELCMKILKNISSDFQLTASIGIGNVYKNIQDFKKSYEEAQKVLMIQKNTASKNSVQFYKNLGIYMILLEIKDHPALTNFYQQVLGKLCEYDDMNDSELIKTLEVYLNENQSIHHAAEKLFIHRNTLKYRLNKIESLCQCSLQDPTDIFHFRFAFYIQKLISEK